MGSTSLPFTLEEDSLISFTIPPTIIHAGQTQAFYIVVSSDSNRGFRIGGSNAPPVTDGKVEIQPARAFTFSELFSKSFSGYTFQGKIVYR